MRIVLFGAGASHGSGTVAPKPPPLGQGLFDALQRLYASWRGVPAAEVERFRANFEEGMAAVIENYGMAVAPLMQDMAVFFSMFSLPEGANNRYVEMLRSVSSRQDVLWSTLNYECLLEYAASSLGGKVNYFGEPGVAQDQIPIWKLHGSCNFKVTGLEAGRGVSFGTGVVFGGGIQPIDPSTVRAHYKGGTALYPAMALFAAGKPIAMSPAPIQEAQRRWKERVLQADRVAVLGVRPNPADSHVWGPIADTPAEVALVCSEVEFAQWRDTSRPSLPSSWLGPTWAQANAEVVGFLGG